VDVVAAADDESVHARGWSAVGDGNHCAIGRAPQDGKVICPVALVARSLGTRKPAVKRNVRLYGHVSGISAACDLDLVA